MQKFDVVILGAGPAGNGLANILGANKLKVALIEAEDLGGGCINKGCVPTKTLIKSARVYELVKNSLNYGVFSDNVRYDFSQMQQRRIDNKNYFNKNMENNLSSNGVTLFKGYGEVLDQNTIKINDQIISFDKLVLATGSRSKIINLKGLEQAKKDGYLIDSTQALTLKDVPKSLVIIGDGPVGLEFSYLYNTLNTEITILTNTDFLSKFDIDIQRSVKQYFKEKNIKVIDNVNISEIKDNKVYYNNTFIQAEKILLAVGRTANNESFKNIDIKKDQNGFVIVDENMKTNFDNIYAIGDITGLRLLSSVGYKTADIVAKDILNFKKSEKLDLNLVPWTIYLNPEIAGIGLTQQQLIEKDETPFEIVIINSQYLPKAHAEGIVKDYSFIKFLISTTTNQILGCFMMIDQANILINHIALFMQQKLTFDTLQKSIYTHPTLSEAFYYTSRSKGLKK